MITSIKYINEDDNQVPNKNIIVYAFDENDKTCGDIDEIIVDFRGNPKRDWFNAHFYYCLPIGIGNQYGFGIKSLYNFKAIWNCVPNIDDLSLEIEDNNSQKQILASQFGSGIITLQNHFMFRTQPGVNIMTMPAPNHFIPGLMAMTGIIETDNLRRDFTFNLKITEPNKEVVVRKGDIVAAFVPIQRYFIDNFKIEHGENIFSNETLTKERNDQIEFTRQRLGEDKNRPHESGRRYYHGEHADGTKYPDHQKRIGLNLLNYDE
jgi:hypothetical protein